MRNIIWIRRLALVGIVLCFGVVVLGAYTRLADAGLGCPDWPGCYGHFTPAGAAANITNVESAWPGLTFESRKAWIEMIHRYAATTLGFIIVLITALAYAARRERVVSLPFAAFMLAVVVMQGVLGMHRSPNRRADNLGIIGLAVAHGPGADCCRHNCEFRLSTCTSTERRMAASAALRSAGICRFDPADPARRLDQY